METKVPTADEIKAEYYRLSHDATNKVITIAATTKGQHVNDIPWSAGYRDITREVFGHTEEPLQNEAISAPIHIIQGPHMYNATCQCDSCADWTAKQNAGMHVDLETVRREAELTQQIAFDEWERGFFRGTRADPIMSIPSSVVIALCDKAEGGTYLGETAQRWHKEACRYTADARATDRENKELRDEIKALKEKPTVFAPGSVSINDWVCACGQKHYQATNTKSIQCQCGNTITFY